MASKPLAMPLFNFRKRQRQALVSDPQSFSAQSSSSSDKAEKCNNNTVDEKSNYESKLECLQNNKPQKSQQVMTNNSVTHGLHTSFPDSSQSKFKSQSFQGIPRGSFRGMKKPTFIGNNATSFHPQETQNTITPLSKGSRGKGYSVNCRGRGYSESKSSNTGNRSNISTFSSSATTSQEEVSYKKGYGNLQQDRKTYLGTTRNRQDDISHMNRINPSLGGQLRVQSGTFQSRFGAQNASQSQNAKGEASTYTQRGQSNNSNSSYASNRSQNISAVNKGARIFDAEDVKYTNATFSEYKSSLFHKRKPDNSLRLFTCPISLMRAWCRAQPFDGPIMFEVYGKVISATTPDKTGTGKEFVLQDDSSSIKCIFYEIDRELPTLMRGQICRVVGTFDKKRGVMKSISVRVASGEERQVYELGCKKTEEEMQKLGFLFNEP